MLLNANIMYCVLRLAGLAATEMALGLRLVIIETSGQYSRQESRTFTDQGELSPFFEFSIQVK